MQNKSNNLIYKAEKTIGNEVIIIKISLNDECENGYQDFSITGEIYKAGRPRNYNNILRCGCIHDDIAKYFPEFKKFILLHLCTWEGVPMYPVSNGLYHMRNGFNNAPADSSKFKAEFCEYYRVTPDQFDALKACKNEVQYYNCLVELGVFEQWKIEARQAIDVLEALTELEFINDSVKSGIDAPSPEEIKEEKHRQKTGYYTPEAEAVREEKTREAVVNEIIQECETECNKHRLERDVKIEVFKKGGQRALESMIFYSHTKELHFNWKSYVILPEEFINELIPKLELPEGVTGVFNDLKRSA